MTLVKANFKVRGVAREEQAAGPDLRDEFEKQILANGARGSFMIFLRQKGDEKVPFVESSIEFASQ